MISPSDDEITDVPGAVTVRTLRQLEEHADAETLRFVPIDPDDLDEYDAVYRWAFRHFPRYVWLDEAGQAAPAQGWPRRLGVYVVQGRKRELGHVACHTRPVEVAKNLIAQAAHVIAFDLPVPEDRRYVAAAAGVPPALFDAEMMALPEYGFVWWDRRAKQLTVCPPIRL